MFYFYKKETAAVSCNRNMQWLILFAKLNLLIFDKKLKMTTIKLKVSDKVLDKVLWLLSHFRSDEVQIVKDDSFEATREYLHKEYDKLKSGKSKLYSLEELEKDLENVISKYEA